MHFLRPKTPTAKRNAAILILSLVLLAGTAAGGTFAYLRTASGGVTNTFSAAKVSVDIQETKTDTTKSDITFKNTGTIPVYIRATLVIYWTDTIDGSSAVIPPPAGSTVNIGEPLNNGWFRVGDIYYYADPVAPGSVTGIMLDPITVTIPEGSSAQCHIDIQAEAIQAEPSSAAESAWPGIKVSGGQLAAD